MSNEKKWYDNNILTNILLFAFFPVGLYALWKSNSIAKWWKITGTLIISILVLGSAGQSEAEEDLSVSNVQLTQAQKDSLYVAEKILREKYTFSAYDLQYAFEDNEIAANKNFQNKNFYVVGEIKSIDTDLFGNPFIILEVGEWIGGIQCFIDDEDAISELTRGQKVTVFGTCKGLTGNVIMKECEIVKNYEDL